MSEDAMKDVAGCDKPKVDASSQRPSDFRMGKPNLTEALCEASADLDYSGPVKSPPEGINASHDNVTDIEARLRRNSGHCSGHEPSLSLLQRTAEEAADTIATLRKQLENAREALERISELRTSARLNVSMSAPRQLSNAREIAREALKGQPC